MDVIGITLCTAKRVDEFHSCVESLVKLQTPENTKIVIVIVDNNDRPIHSDYVSGIDSGEKHIVYDHFPSGGIPHARNRSVELGRAAGAGYIAFIDDDETAPADWIVKFHDYANSSKHSIFRGPVYQLLDDDPPLYFFTSHKELPKTGTVTQKYTTANTFVNLSRIDGRRVEFTFDEKALYSGGSDTILFRKLAQLGYHMVSVREAAVFEVLKADRMTWQYIVREAMRKTANFYMDDQSLYIKMRYFLMNLIIKTYLLIGAVLMYPFALILSPRVSKYIAKEALVNLGGLAGVLVGATGSQPKHYLPARREDLKSSANTLSQRK